MANVEDGSEGASMSWETTSGLNGTMPAFLQALLMLEGVRDVVCTGP